MLGKLLCKLGFHSCGPWENYSWHLRRRTCLRCGDVETDLF